MSKAAEKRAKDLKNRVDFLVRSTLKEFENDYVGRFSEWRIMELEHSLRDFKRLHGTLKPNQEKLSKWQEKEYNYTRSIDHLTDLLSRRSLLSLEYMTEAKKGYDLKVNKLVDTLCGYGIQTQHLTIDSVSTTGTELSFLIHDNDITVHARAIWVNGVEVCPHYRFITTKRAR